LGLWVFVERADKVDSVDEVDATETQPADEGGIKVAAVEAEPLEVYCGQIEDTGGVRQR
jgi:hypothetical protein